MIRENILAIDPGPKESAFVIFYPGPKEIITSGKISNADMIREICEVAQLERARHIYIEMIQSFGMAVGAEVFETCVWVGRFMQEWENRPTRTAPQRLYRGDIKNFICRSHRATDANIRQALIDRFGGTDVAIGGKKCGQCKGRGHIGRIKPCPAKCPECLSNPGWKHPPGPLKGISGDCWSALAVAVTAAETRDP